MMNKLLWQRVIVAGTMVVGYLMMSCSGGCAAILLVVDRTHAGASDNNPGTAEQPFHTTIGRAMQALAAGDTVLIKAGVYRESVNVVASGTAEKPITIEAAPVR